MKKLGTITLWLGMLLVALCAFSLAPAGAFAASAGAALPLPLFGLMIVNRSTISAIFVNLKTTFNNAFDAAPSVWQKIAMLVPSSSKSNDYAWLSMFPKMRKWVGEKVVKSFSAFKYTIINDDWEATVEVDRNDIEDDNLGIYAPQAQMAGWSARQLPDEIVIALVNNAFTATCYDNQFFCDTDHPVGNESTGVASVSNKGVVVLSCATLALAQASYGVARTAMKKFKNDDGQPLNITPNVLLCGPALEDTALTLKNNERLEDGKQNPYRGTFEVVVDSRITSDTAWFLLDTTKPIKPFIYQERKAPNFVEVTDPQSEDVFKRKKFLFGAEARAAGGYGFWQLCWGSTGLGA